MDKRIANIDIVFRNGLKDYEVLPPSDVWINIAPVVKKKQRPYLLLRAAAMITVVCSIGSLAYYWGQELLVKPAGFFMSANEESIAPVFISPIRVVYKQPAKEMINKQVKLTVVSDESLSDKQALIADNTSAITVADNAPVENEAKTRTRPRRPGIDELFALKVKSGSSTDNSRYPESEDIDTPKASGRWSVSGSVSPTYSDIFGQEETSVSESEQPLISYGGGVGLAYNINKRFSVSSGLFYSSFGQSINNIGSYSGFKRYDNSDIDHNFMVVTSEGLICTTNSNVYLSDENSADRVISKYSNNETKSSLQYLDNDLRQKLGYLELPLIMKYKVIDRTIDFNLIGGLSSNFLVNNTVYTTSDGSRYNIGKTEGVNTIAISSSVGMGVEYAISDKLQLNLEPTLRYFINPFTDASGITIHPYSFGIFSGVCYKF